MGIFDQTSRLQGPSHIYVVDDKPDVLRQVMELQDQAGFHGVTLHNYHLKLGDPEADAGACFKYLQTKRDQHSQADQTMAIVLDFDGVLFATDQFLASGVTGKLWGLMGG